MDDEITGPLKHNGNRFPLFSVCFVIEIAQGKGLAMISVRRVGKIGAETEAAGLFPRKGAKWTHHRRGASEDARDE
ncbi:hypothetical protein [Aeromonas simiae]|uniref:hypothetical protein n=1 Tax=Aeromonas simiae TaxID=218936 RepID=UPI0012ED8DC4|nr:hypothetical protein [Aeromonas simiae]